VSRHINISRLVSRFSASILLVLPAFALAAGGVVTDPTGVAPDRYVYYPGTEPLSKKEIRATSVRARWRTSRPT
jgi:hypothetical protein